MVIPIDGDRGWPAMLQLLKSVAKRTLDGIDREIRDLAPELTNQVLNLKTEHFAPFPSLLFAAVAD